MAGGGFFLPKRGVGGCPAPANSKEAISKIEKSTQNWGTVENKKVKRNKCWGQIPKHTKSGKEKN